MSICNINQDFSTFLHKQIHGNSFDFLSEHLGDDIVARIPTVTLPQMDFEGLYPEIWSEKKVPPADVVKGLFPKSKRPFLTLKYVDAKINKCIIETFFQKYNNETHALCENILNCSASNNMTPLANFRTHWTSTSTSENKICHGLMTIQHFSTIKNLILGESLELTQGRFLPIYRYKF